MELRRFSTNGDTMKVGFYRLKFLLAVYPIFLVGLVYPVESGVSQTNYCDPDLLQPKENPLGYRMRGDRCEGSYIEQVASTPLSVASLTRVFEEYDLGSDQDLKIEWPPLGDDAIHLRAYGIYWRLYYRMDSLRSKGATSYIWPIGILSALNVPKPRVGVIGWTHLKVGESTRKIYLPLEITQSGNRIASDGYHLVLWPGVELEEIYLSLATTGENGDPENYFQQGRALGYGFYPPQRPIEISISELPTSGFYYLDVSATLKSGGSTGLHFLLYHQRN